ncbi:MAG: CidA/LrgA family protein [Alphaproteobacteria bacterium]|nr:CidA/LrgA family protein [Alphaproteobacteria bacterium]
MIVALATLLLCQLAGEIMARGLSLPLPGPVLGAALLFALLMIRQRFAHRLPREINDGSLDTAAKFLLANLSLLFVPAGVGVVQNLAVFRLHGVALAAALIVSTVLALLVTAFVFLAASRAMGDAGADEGAPKP